MHPEGRPLPHGRKTHLGNRVTPSPARAPQLKPSVALKFSCYQAGNRKLRGSVLEPICVHYGGNNGHPDKILGESAAFVAGHRIRTPMISAPARTPSYDAASPVPSVDYPAPSLGKGIRQSPGSRGKHAAKTSSSQGMRDFFRIRPPAWKGMSSGQEWKAKRKRPEDGTDLSRPDDGTLLKDGPISAGPIWTHLPVHCHVSLGSGRKLCRRSAVGAAGPRGGKPSSRLARTRRVDARMWFEAPQKGALLLAWYSLKNEMSDRFRRLQHSSGGDADRGGDVQRVRVC